MQPHDLPTLVLVHGAWHQEAMWHPLIQELPDSLDIRTLQLPSSAPVPPEHLGSLYDDAKAIRDLVDAIDGPVVAVAHSYGGAPLSQGLVGAPNVLRLVYLAAFQLDVGESMTSIVGERPYFWGADHYDEGYYEMTDPVGIFYPDLEPEVAAKAAAALTLQSVSSLENTLTQAAWHTIDSTFIHASNDVAAPLLEPFSQRSQRVRKIATAHAPFISRPAELAEMLLVELNEADDA
ncbi:alpha/beta hydrolase [Actinoplanes sp. HUAS TT8]|uniref:alpha/beta hydrolase n=1 Tax=Actinoplanes sp. HUAS TT8 TaxID=3447453 RepID=UPI003F520B6F